MDKKIMRVAAKKYQDHILSPLGFLMDVECTDGFDAICAISKEFGGSTIYIPTLRSIFKSCIEQDILHSGNEKGVRELMQDYGYGERHIRNLLRHKGKV